MKNDSLQKLKPLIEKTKEKISTHHILLALILAVGAFLRFKGLNFQSLWFDELLTVAWSAPYLSVSKIIGFYHVDPHPVLFPLILHYWMVIFGPTQAAARFLVALIGIAGIYGTYTLGKESFNKTTGLIAAAIVTLSSYQISFSQEVRPYIFVFTATALSYAYFIRLFRERNRKNIILYGVFTALMLWSHYYGLITLLAQGIFLVFFIVFEKKLNWSFIKHFFYSYILAAVLYSPWIPTTFKMMGRSGHWTKMPKRDFFSQWFETYFGSEPFLVLIFSSLIMLLLFFYMTYYMTRFHSPAPGSGDGNDKNDFQSSRLYISIPALFSGIFLSLFIPYYRSLTKVPMLFHKYSIGTLAMFIVLPAIGIALFKNRTFRALMLTAIIAVSLVNIYYHKDYYNKVTKNDWRGMAALAAEKHTERFGGNSIYILSKQNWLYRFYLDDYEMEKVYLPRNSNQFKKVLEEKKDKITGIWILPTWRRDFDKQTYKLLDSHFPLVETFKSGKSSIILRKPKPAESIEPVESIDKEK